MTTRFRWIAAVVLIVVSSVGALGSAVAWWSHRQLLDTDNWVEMVGPLGSNPDVAGALSDYVAADLIEWLDPQALLQEALPDNLRVLAVPLSVPVEDFVRRGVDTVIFSDQFGELWIDVNRRGHAAALHLLRGGGDVIAVDDGVVTVDVSVVAAAVVSELADGLEELFGGDFTVPPVAEDLVPEDVRSDLAVALDRELPAEFGVVELFASDDLAVAQDAVALLDRLAWLLPVLTLIAAGLALFVAPGRRRTMVFLVAGAALGWAAAVAVIDWVTDLIVDRVVDPENQLAAAAIVTEVAGGLGTLLRTMLIAAIVALFILVLGPPLTRAFRQSTGDPAVSDS